MPPVRIIAGSAGRVRIQVPGCVVRPSTDFIRQAMFSILGKLVEDAQVLDLFAGCGALGLEALSRGARSCLFVDESRRCLQTISGNLATARLTGGRMVCDDVFDFLDRCRESFDLVLADPPYERSGGSDSTAARLLLSAGLSQCLAPGGWLVLELPADPAPPAGPGWQLRDHRRYGGSAIALYEAGGPA